MVRLSDHLSGYVVFPASNGNLSVAMALTYAVSFVISAGLFGYLGGESSALAGNMLTMYPENFVSALVRIGFLYTVTASFPLMLFPLRSALNSLLFEEVNIKMTLKLSQMHFPNCKIKRLCRVAGVIYLLACLFRARQALFGSRSGTRRRRLTPSHLMGSDSGVAIRSSAAPATCSRPCLLTPSTVGESVW
ncbi:unnamed protein product [Schistocephalus solidus]|uniref:Aa_trans domain-containing protein n=1 Tax=Schistocephalus solidus TaxID=70667 RepID=A0A183SWE5_SCHSO|nr:unnamed protein product [Schistocephalus solidus]